MSVRLVSRVREHSDVRLMMDILRLTPGEGWWSVIIQRSLEAPGVEAVSEETNTEEISSATKSTPYIFASCETSKMPFEGNPPWGGLWTDQAALSSVLGGGGAV